jgi:hypothetical protein
MNVIAKKYWTYIIIVFVIFILLEPILNLLLIGGLVLFFSLEYLVTIEKLKKNGKEQTGKYLHFEVDGEEGHKTPTIEFITHTGNIVKEQPYYYASTDLSKIKSYNNKIGKPVTIIYDSENPEKFILKKEKNFNYFSLFLMIFIGLMFIVFGTLGILGIIAINI